jgi:hypothetical protein
MVNLVRQGEEGEEERKLIWSDKERNKERRSLRQGA